MPLSPRKKRVLVTAPVLAMNTVMMAAIVLAAVGAASSVPVAGTVASATSPARPEAKPPDAGSYGCPMHPDVRSPVPGTCPICGMDLLPMGAPGGPPTRVALETIPAAVHPGETSRLRFRLKDPGTDAAITKLQIVHEKPFHLFLVSDDLEVYQHLHPTLGDDGAFEVDSVLPRAGLYHVFCDFLPVGGTPQVAHLVLTTAGSPPERPARPATRLAPDTKLEKVVDGIRFRLALEPSVPASGLPLALQYHLEDASTGAPITDLEPYLGAWGHTLVLAADATDFVHSHPTRLIPAGADRAAARSGPDVAFNARLTKPGAHRLWSQFQRAGKVTTVSFTIDVASATRLAVWDGTRWSPIGARNASGKDAAMTDLDGAVRAIAVRGKDLFVGGEIMRAGGLTVSRIARWDGSGWSALGSGVNGTVHAIAVSGKNVYVGGDFTEAGGAPASGIARWDGRAWSPLGEGVTGCRDEFCTATVNAIAIDPNGGIVVGGRFARAGRVEASGVARWDGNAWQPLGGGVRTGERDGEVLALALGSGGRLFAGGRFASAGDVRARSIAMWDGSRWSALGDGIAGGLEKVAALGVAKGVLYAGGDFTRAGTVDVARAARWDGTSWSALGLRTREPVETITVAAGRSGGRSDPRGGQGARVPVILGGGAFTLADGSTTRGVVGGDGATWSALGSGIGGGAFLAPLQSVAIDEKGRIYAGGGPFIIRGK